MCARLNTVEDLHEKFRSVISLTSLVAAINNKGSPSLAKSYQRNQYTLQTLPEQAATTNAVLDALTILLTRDAETIAVAAYDLPFARVSAPDYMRLVAVVVPAVNCTRTLAEPESALNSQDLSYKGCMTGLNDGEHAYDFRDLDLEANRVGMSHLPHLDSRRYNLDLHSDPLSNHIATVVEYLGEYKKKKTSEERRRYFQHFAVYIMAQGWKKMRRRIVHWSSLAFIYHLSQATEERLRLAFTFYMHSNEAEQFPKRNDSVLGRLLISMHDQGQIASIIMQHCGRKELSSERLDHLVAAFREVVRGSESSAEVPGKAGMGAYNEHTCWDFHKLLLATLLAYGRALDELGNVDEKLHPDLRRRRKLCVLEVEELKNLKQQRADCVKGAQLCGIVLWRIAYSGALQHHLRVLRGCAALNLPHNNVVNFAWYRLYTGFPRVPSTNGTSSEYDGEYGRVGDIEVDQEFECIKERSEGSAEAYLNWIRLQVADWVALETVSFRVRDEHAPSRLEVSLVAVESPNIHKELHVEPWRTTVGDLLTSGSQLLTSTDLPKAEAVINTITHCIHREKVAAPWVGHILQAFQDDPKPIRFCGTLHSEAVLASLNTHTENLLESRIKVLIQDLDQSFIAIPKPCCPACWELLHILRDDTNNFNVRGHHTMVYPFELPQWLPRNTVEKMVDRFESILLGEIITLMRQ